MSTKDSKKARNVFADTSSYLKDLEIASLYKDLINDGEMVISNVFKKNRCSTYNDYEMPDYDPYPAIPLFDNYDDLNGDSSSGINVALDVEIKFIFKIRVVLR